MPKKRKLLKNPNGYGSIKKLSGNRRRPYMVQVNPRINDKGSYSYDILGYYELREDAMIALALYNKDPFNIKNKNITFAEIYQAFYKDKYEMSKKKFSDASLRSTTAAFNNLSVLHSKKFGELRYTDLQQVIDNCPLKHASLELMVSLLKQMYTFAMREEIVDRNISQFVKINILDDDEHGIRFAQTDIDTLWQHIDDDDVKIILIYLYTGWRATELLDMPKTNIYLDNMTMQGGKKTKAGKNRIVPIHSKIKEFVSYFYNLQGDYLFSNTAKPLSYAKLSKRFTDTLRSYHVTTKYTLHDCRHTFSSLLSDIGTPDVIRDRLMGHASQTLDDKVYVHKTIEQLKEWVNKIP